MKTYEVKIQGISPLIQGKWGNAPKEPKEGADAYERRTWRNRMHVNKDGFVFIPPFAFKNCLDQTATYLGVQIPGKGKSTYTKHFRQGVIVTDPLTLDVKAKDVKPFEHFVPSDGKPSAFSKGTRVIRFFPEIPEWGGSFQVHVLDETVTEDVLTTHLQQAGLFTGIGTFRPANRGINGRFKVVSVKAI